jgi:hypothetical protein
MLWDRTVSSHFDGTSGRLSLPDEQPFVRCLGSSASDIWSAGINGLLGHFDGTTWRVPSFDAA